MISTLRPNKNQLKALSASDNQNSFAMLGMMKFKTEGGREAYLKYMAESAPFYEKVGAEVVYFGKANEWVYGSDEWDVVMMIRYRSRRAFLQLANDPGYLEAHEYLAEAQEKTVLLALDPITYRQILSEI